MSQPANLLPIYDMKTKEGQTGFLDRLERLRETTAVGGKTAEVITEVIERVQANGDKSVVEYMRRWTDADYVHDRIKVKPEELAEAAANLDPTLRGAIKGAIENVRDYQQHILPKDPPTHERDGAELGLRFTPVSSCGLAVPGGRAAYPSSVVMLAIPAIVAGVPKRNICVVTPPPTRTDEDKNPTEVSPLVLAACHLCGIETVYRIGGAQAMAALAFGTETVKPVDLIVGPGNVFVQYAKALLAGRVGIDGFYGPSEIVTVADASANPAYIASDLLAQAEHDPGKCFLVAWDKAVIDAVEVEISRQLIERHRGEAIRQALIEDSAAVLVSGPHEAIQTANTLAAEHLNLAVEDPDAMLAKVRHAGEVFLGDQSPVASGDYWAGPSHCLPTGTTARFSSGISVYTFLKRMGTVAYRNGMSDKTIAAIARLAEAEGLDAHAASVRRRSQHWRD